MSRYLFAILLLGALAACKIGEDQTTFPVAANCSPVGNACASHADCCSFGCELGVCARNPDVGGACRTSDDCYWTMTCQTGACVPGALCRNDTDVCDFDNACCSGNCTTGTCLPNHAPTVDLGPDRTVSFFTSQALGGTIADQDGDGLVYGWTLVSGPAASALGGWTSSAPSPTVFLDVPGAYTFRLVVTDGPPSQRNRLTSVPDDVVLTALNDPPAVSAGADATLSRAHGLVLEGTVSDPNGAAAVVSCEWRVTPPGGSESTVATFATCPAAPAYTWSSPQAGPEGAWTFTLVASDGENVASDVRTVTLVNDAPVLGALPARAGNLGPGGTAGAAIPVTATATDTNGDVAFTWTWTFDQVASGSLLTSADLVGADTAAVSFSPDALGPDASNRYVLRVRVCDAAPACTEGTVPVNVYRHVQDLGHPVADAEWAAGSIFMVGADPAGGGGKLWVYSGGTLQQQVALATPPTQVGVDPTGKLVVTGDDVYVRWVDLNATTPTPGGLASPYPIGDVAVSDTRYAVLFPATGTPFLQILDLSAGAFDPTTRYGRYGTASPSGGKLGNVFVVDDHFAYGDLTEYAVQNPGTLNLVQASTGYACRLRLWAAANGAHLFDACGDVHTTAALAFTKSLGATGLRHVHSAPTGEAIALDAAGTSLLRYDASFNAVGTEAIPIWGFSGTGHPAAGKRAFVSADGTTRWVIVEANGHTGLVTYP